MFLPDPSEVPRQLLERDGREWHDLQSQLCYCPILGVLELVLSHSTSHGGSKRCLFPECTSCKEVEKETIN